MRRGMWSFLLPLPRPWPGRIFQFQGVRTAGFPSRVSSFLKFIACQRDGGARRCSNNHIFQLCIGRDRRALLVACADVAELSRYTTVRMATLEEMWELGWQNDGFFQGLLGCVESCNIVPPNVRLFNHYNT